MTNCICCDRPLEHWCRRLGRDVSRCRRCGLICVPAGLKRLADGRTIYEDESLFVGRGNEAYYLDETNLLAARRRARWMTTYLPTGSRLLDVGASFGHFLKACEGLFAAKGVEINRYAVEWSRRHFGVDNNVRDVMTDGSATELFDAVTLWDIVEHVGDPVGLLREASKVLERDGLLFLSTPDAGSLVARMLGRWWYYNDPEQHIFLFNRGNLVSLLSSTGFEILGMRSVGRDYRASYVLRRLAFLYPKVLGPTMTGVTRAFPALGTATVYLNAGDTVMIACRKRG